MTIFRPVAFLPVIAALGLAAAPLTASAEGHHAPGGGQHPPGGPHGGPGHMMPPIPPGITLTAAQQAKLKTIFEKAHQDEHALRLEGHVIEGKIHDALDAVGDLDRATLADLGKQEDSIKAKVSALHLETMEQLHDLLTPAQRQQAKETMDKIKALHEQMKALMGPPPEGEPDDMP
ncbi:Spy/CpxP family protein refolding chaperone [Gluconobacter sp. Dm-62]|uniref:Spy/CpxP family protein refolding chaperone n=1 Tax=Gluconobacter sp. Dm-62 TaxID=2799804 RepID=UPI0020120E23|nr:Spy/CpxP family protein refolding chaperone [Gluconobacter sp. Dm-62]